MWRHLSAANDSKHLLTAGWLGETIETAPFVDFLSFHYWSSDAGLADKIASLREQSGKPILVEEMGLPGVGADGEAEQAENVERMIQVVNSSAISGWMIWTAFDFFALPDELSSSEYRFGLWRNDLSPKPALDRLPIPTRIP